MKWLPLVWGNLKRHRARAALTVAVVALSFFLFGILQSVKSSFAAGIQTQALERLLVVNRLSVSEPVMLSAQAKLQAVPGVKAVTHVSYLAAYYQDPKQTLYAQPVNVATYLDVYPEFKVDPAVRVSWEKTRNGALIGPDLVKQYGWKVGDQVPVQSGLYRQANGSNVWPVIVVGTFEGPAGSDKNRNLLMHFDYVDQSRTADTERVGWYVVQLDKGADTAAVGRTIDATFENSEKPTRSFTERDIALKLVNQFGNVGALLTAMAAVVFATMLVLVTAALAQSIRERAAENATLLTLGMRRGPLCRLLVLEAVLLIAPAALFGLLGAWLLVSGLAPKVSVILPALQLKPITVAIGIAIAMAAAVIGALAPVIETWRRPLARSLRQ